MIAANRHSVEMAALKEGDPRIWTRGERNRIRVAVARLVENEIDIVIGRLQACLAGPA